MNDNKEKVILIADYGRSGQGWLSYMLCYILNAKYIEPYDFLKGRLYSSSDYIISLTSGNLPGREKTKYSMVVKTHNYPADDFNLTDKVIFLVRDPRDAAVSCYYRIQVMAKKKLSGSLKDKFYNLVHKFRLTSYIFTAYKWKKHCQAWENVKYHLVRYEDLSLNARETLKSVLTYLRIEIDEEIIEDAIKKFSFEKITSRKKGEEDKENPEFRKGIIGDYKNNFSKLELEIFRFICGKKAKKVGYII